MKTFTYNIYKDYPGQRGLLLSTEKNYNGKIRSFDDLNFTILSRQLVRKYNIPFDIIKYQKLPIETIGNYSHLALVKTEGGKDTRSKFLKRAKRFIRQFSGFKIELDLHEYNDDLRQFIFNDSRSLIIGDDYCLNLWDKDSQIWRPHGFDFPSVKKYDDLTIFFGELKPENEVATLTLADNLWKRMVKVNARRRYFILPIDVNGYDDLFNQVMLTKLQNTDFYVLKHKKFRKRFPWKNNIWNYDEEKYNSNENRYETIKVSQRDYTIDS